MAVGSTAVTAADLSAGRYRAVTGVQHALVTQVQRIWRGLSPGTIASDLEGPAGAAILQATAAGQLTVAQGATAFVAGAMAEQGGTAVAEAALTAAAFAGIAPDGGLLETLLFLPAIGVQQRLAAGLTASEAMLGGLADMAMYTATAVADTARAADQVAMAANRQCVAYARVVRLPACARCIVLAGQQYAYSEGFQRHPNCDCQTVPLREPDWAGVQSPDELFASMTAAQQRRVFGADGALAISHGADVGQVVNARRGMSVSGTTTSEGTTRRGLYGRRAAGAGTVRYPGDRYARAATPRLTPQQIFAQAVGRREQIALLRRYGYIT